MPRKNPKDCWLCGKPILESERGLDPFGFPVYIACERKRIEAEKRAPPKPKS